MLQPSLGFFDQGLDLTDRAFYDTALRPYGLGTTLPSLAYRSKAFADLEDEKIWTRSWVCVGHHDRIPAPGDILPFTVGNHGVHLRRRSDLGLEAHFNFAQHGGCRFVPKQCQTGRKTSCFYTSCGHSLDRDVLPADPGGAETPEMYMYLGNNPDKLIPVHVARLGSLGFVSLDTGARFFGHELGALAAPLGQYLSRGWQRLDRFQTTGRFNWKLFPHGALGLETVLPATLHDDHEGAYWGLSFGPGDEPARPLARDGAPLAFGPETEAHRIWLYPNVLLQLGERTMTTVVVQPVGLTETLLHVEVFCASAGADQPTIAGDDPTPVQASKVLVEQWTALAETAQQALAGSANPSPFLPQQAGDQPARVEASALLLDLQRFMVERLLVRHEYVDRPLYTNPGRSLNAGVNAGAG